MDRSLYIAMNAAQQTMLAQATNANNLANINTTGFRADFEQFRSMPVFGEGLPSRVYSMTERPGTDYQQGTVQSTGRELDISVQGEGFIAVQGKDGRESSYSTFANSCGFCLKLLPLKYSCSSFTLMASPLC